MYARSASSTVTKPVTFPVKKDRAAILPRTIDLPTLGRPWKTTNAFEFQPPP